MDNMAVDKHFYNRNIYWSLCVKMVTKINKQKCKQQLELRHFRCLLQKRSRFALMVSVAEYQLLCNGVIYSLPNCNSQFVNKIMHEEVAVMIMLQRKVLDLSSTESKLSAQILQRFNETFEWSFAQLGCARGG